MGPVSKFRLALAGVPLHGMKEFAGHASITETERYLEYMLEQVELAAAVSTHMAQLANLKPRAVNDESFQVQCPKCENRFQVAKPKKHKYLTLVAAAGYGTLKSTFRLAENLKNQAL